MPGAVSSRRVVRITSNTAVAHVGLEPRTRRYAHRTSAPNAAEICKPLRPGTTGRAPALERSASAKITGVGSLEACGDGARSASTCLPISGCSHALA